jgi:hypothetical protein
VREENLAATKIEAGKFLAQCQECGLWHEVTPELRGYEGFFEEWAGEFRCCDRDQTAVFTVEKDYLDFH